MRNAVFALCAHINMLICIRLLFLIVYAIHVQFKHARIQRGGGGGGGRGPGPPLQNHKNIGFLRGSNLSSHTRKMQVKKAISEVVFSLLAFSREWKFGAVIHGS